MFLFKNGIVVFSLLSLLHISLPKNISYRITDQKISSYIPINMYMYFVYVLGWIFLITAFSVYIYVLPILCHYVTAWLA